MCLRLVLYLQIRLHRSRKSLILLERIRHYDCSIFFRGLPVRKGVVFVFAALLFLCALPAMADGIDSVSVSNATFTGQCSSGPCTETFNFSFDISANIDWSGGGPRTIPITGVMVDATGFLGQFSNPGVANIFHDYIGFYDGLGDEVDLLGWGPAGFSGPGNLALYACQSAACINAFSSVPGAFVPPFGYVSWWINSTGGTMNVTDPANVPEPSSFLLLGVGLLGLAAFSWKRRVRHAGKATRLASL